MGEVDAVEAVSAAAGGAPVTTHGGSIAWNAYRKKWVAIFTQFGGDSPLGEIWYAESDAPTGPWGAAVKVVTHNNYTFYNPLLHPELTPDDSPVLCLRAPTRRPSPTAPSRRRGTITIRCCTGSISTTLRLGQNERGGPSPVPA